MPRVFIDLIYIGTLLTIGLVVGKILENRHFKKLAQQESELDGIKLTNLKKFPKGYNSKDFILVHGSVCIATDYSKVFIAGIRNLFGGEMKSYGTLMERGRREAIIRMKLNARKYNASEVWNVRFETATIQGRQKQKAAGIEIIAYGTAVVSK